jgi:hypothetical protein
MPNPDGITKFPTVSDLPTSSATVSGDYSSRATPLKRADSPPLKRKPSVSIDFSSAYLNRDLEEDVYVTQPEGFPQGECSQLLKLHKSLYGLKQADQQWTKTSCRPILPARHSALIIRKVIPARSVHYLVLL